MGLLLDVIVAAAGIALFGLPLALTITALLDAARRPGWVWALAGRRQVLWMAIIMFAVLTVVGGVLVSGYYLLRVRPQLVAVEEGRLG